MKKPRLLMLCASATAACLGAGQAAAQSSVTLYGRIDANVTHMTGEGWYMDQASTSRLGVRGKEDMGNGLSTLFQFESRINPKDGSTESPRFWGREAWVGLQGNWGTLRLGRSLSPSQRIASGYDPHGTDGIGSFGSSGLLLGLPSSTFVRFDSGIYYETPKFGGFTLFGAGTVKGESESYSIRLRYANGPFDGSLGYGRHSSGNHVASLGLSYDFKFIKPMLQYHSGKRASRKRATWLVGATAPLGPGKLRFAYSMQDDKGAAPQVDRKLISLGYDYSLSKRTLVYGTVVHDKQDGDRRRHGVELGIRHSF